MKHSLDKSRRIPFYRQCAQTLRSAIEDGTYKIDEYLPPERQLSEQLGVNRLTLRKGLLDLVRETITPVALNQAVTCRESQDAPNLLTIATSPVPSSC